MKPDGLVTILGEPCVHGKAAESTEHLIFFIHVNIMQLLPKNQIPACVCGLTLLKH